MTTDERASWKSRTGFLLAIIGSAIGLGNIWRFPYLAYKNGGGAFLIPYMIGLLTIGIPMMILEIGIGHKFRASAPVALARIGRRWEFIGWWMIIFVFFGIQLYYCVILSWCFNYLRFAFSLEWGKKTADFFNNQFLRTTSDPLELGGFNLPILIGLALVWLVNWAIVYRGIRKGIERANKFMMPFLFLIMLTLVVWSATLPGAAAGLKMYLVPDFSKLLNLTIWTDAFSQIFFTLSLGFGIIITYASYLPQKTNIKSNAVITCLSDSAFSIFACCAVFATLGFISHATGRPISEVFRGGPGLAFVTYPETINMLPFGRKIFGVLFFVGLIFAGISSSISIYESVVASFMDKFGWNRKRVTTAMCVAGFLGGVIFTTGAGLYWIDTVDFFLNHFGLLVAGFFEAIIVGWIYEAGKLREHKNAVGAALYENVENMRYYKFRYHVGKWWEYAIMIWIPLVLGAMILLELYKQIKTPYSGYGWFFVVPVGFGWIFMTLVVSWFLKSRPWKQPEPKETGL